MSPFPLNTYTFLKGGSDDSETCATCARLLQRSAAAARPRVAAMADAADADASFTCEMCYDDCTVAQSLSLCASNHRFCAECCWRCCQSALGDGLVPACPFDKQHKCGAIGKEVACAALSAWLRGDVTRKAELGDWAIGGSASKGFTSGKLDAVYLSAHRARQGAVQCTQMTAGQAQRPWCALPAQRARVSGWKRIDSTMHAQYQCGTYAAEVLWG